LIAFPNAKINIGLRVTEKRPDGFHNIETCFYPVQWCDALEIVESDRIEFQSTGLPIPGSDAQNLCMKAYHLLKEEYSLPNIKIHLHKAIPIGAGLGGGSSDAAFMLTLLNDCFNLGLSMDRLSFYAEQLGSDCVFYLKNRPSLGTGKGEQLSDIRLDLSNYNLVLVYPDIHVTTAEAYANVTPMMPGADERLGHVLTEKQPEEWKDLVINDFEKSVFIRYPKLAKLKTYLYDHDALYVSMSGSGSVIYGIFNAVPSLDLPDNYTVWSSRTLDF
jgi:4-diphosphocytidyl-2-C-methyl-D-erythritol kinase